MKQLSSGNDVPPLTPRSADAEIKRKRMADRFDFPSSIEMQEYITVLEEIVQKKNETIAELTNSKEFYKPIDQLRICEEPVGSAECALSFLFDIIENQPMEIKTKIIKRWQGMLNSKLETSTKKSLKNFKLQRVKSKYQYVDISENENETESLDVSTLEPLDGVVQLRCDLPKPKVSELLYNCLVEDFMSSQILYYQQLQILTQLFISPLRNLLLAPKVISVLDDHVPPLMSIERRIVRALQTKDSNSWQTIKDSVNEMSKYIPYISAIKTTTIRSEIVECCTTKRFKDMQQELLVEFTNKNGPLQLLPVTAYLDAPINRFTRYPKIFGDILSSIDPKHKDYAFLTSCYLNSNKLIRKLEVFRSIQEQQQNVVDLQKLFKDTEIEAKDRKLLYFGPLKIVEEKFDWRMCFVFNDTFIVSNAIVVGRLGGEKESLMRFENVPSGTRVNILRPYRFVEELRIPLVNAIIKNVVDCANVVNAFMIQVDDIQLHCCCISIKERYVWTNTISSVI